MQINIKATNLELTEALKDYANDKFSDLDKFFLQADKTDIQAWVELGQTTKHHKSGEIFRAEIQIKAPGIDERKLRAVSEKEDLYAAIDSVRDEIVGEIKKTKDKKISLVRRGARALKNLFNR